MNIHSNAPTHPCNAFTEAETSIYARAIYQSQSQCRIRITYYITHSFWSSYLIRLIDDSMFKLNDWFSKLSL